MKLLIIPSWYTRDILKFNSEANNENPTKENEVLIYKTESVNLFPKIPKRAFKMYKDSILSLVKNVVEKSKPEFVFINSSLYGGAAVARYLHSNMIPFMVSEHLKEFIIDGEFSIFEKNCISECYKYASKIIATSDALKSNIIKKFNGLPFIATKCGGPESIVLPDTGILIEPNNSTELYTAMKNIIDKYDEFDSIKIREIALKSYSDNAYGNNIREAINSVISASN